MYGTSSSSSVHQRHSVAIHGRLAQIWNEIPAFSDCEYVDYMCKRDLTVAQNAVNETLQFDNGWLCVTKMHSLP